MTKDNPVAAGVAHDLIAETIWRSEWRRAGNGGERRVPWSEIAEKDQERYRFLARDVAALFAASPVQAGIDPLVAEMIERLAQWEENIATMDGKHVLVNEAIAALRSQAERIAALEVERDTAWSDSEHDKESALSAERLGREYLDRAIAAESLLAEAREALERYWQGRYFAMTTDADADFINATLSRLKPGEKGGSGD